MANSKHAHLRYNLIDRYLQNKNYTFDQLLEKLNEEIADVYPGEGISVRTLREDLKVFRDKEKGFGAPLPEKIRNLCYSDRKFSIATKPLLEYEQYLIDAAYQLLDRFDNHPKYSNLWNALASFQDAESADADENYSRVLFHDNNEAYTGAELLKPMFLAIKKKQVLQLTTEKFDGTDNSSFIFHPHILKQYNQRWYVFGYNANKNIARWSVPLDDRLKSYEVNNDVTYQADSTDWENFFREMVGPTHMSITQESPETEHVVLRFDKKRLPYFKSKPIHPFWDEFTEDGKKDQVFFEAIINRELVQQLLSYGKDVEVLEPESLKLKMKEQAEAMMKYY
ncbi:helix-turn-helix transcriptional regulator [Nonlabens ulvanivorans]|uniref:helix-turn-helix transcriptional regulator n=1 Tax=Nonlabens ulvanivorans TaxID=906888 RepID=UPI00326592DD